MRHLGWSAAARLAFLLTVSTTIVLPLATTILGGFKTNAELRGQPFGFPETLNLTFYAEILGNPDVWLYMWNSFLISICSVILTLLLGSMAAYAFMHAKFIGSKFLFSYLLLGLMFPLAAATMPLFLTIRELGLLNSAWAVILPQVAFGMAFSVMFFKAFFQELPGELFEAARVDGCGYVRFFFLFTLPLSGPILATISVFVFVSSWNNYLLPLIMINDRSMYTWTLGAMDYRGQYVAEWNRTLAFVTVTMAPAILFFILAQKYIVAGLTGGSVKG